MSGMDSAGGESSDDRDDPYPSESLVNCLSQLDCHDVSDLDSSDPCSPEKQLDKQDGQSDASRSDMQAHPSTCILSFPSKILT